VVVAYVLQHLVFSFAKAFNAVLLTNYRNQFTSFTALFQYDYTTISGINI